MCFCEEIQKILSGYPLLSGARIFYICKLLSGFLNLPPSIYHHDRINDKPIISHRIFLFFFFKFSLFFSLYLYLYIYFIYFFIFSVLSKIVADTLNLFYHFSEKIRLDLSCASPAQ